MRELNPLAASPMTGEGIGTASKVARSKKPWQISLQKFLRQPVSVISTIVTLLIIIFAIVGSFYAAAAAKPDYSAVLKGPSGSHIFGTDEFGRDILSRLLAGAHLSLEVGLSSVAIGAVVGTLLGLIAGYYGGWREVLIMRLTDVLLAFPGILLAIGVIAILGGGVLNVILAVAVFTVPIFIRLVQGSTIAVKDLPFVEAARTVGMSDFRLIIRHILPNLMSTIVVYLTMRIGTAILIAASLSFLGLGVSPSTPEWGAMLNSAQDYVTTAPWTILAPGLAILITVLAFNLMGDGLRDAFDSKIKG